MKMKVVALALALAVLLSATTALAAKPIFEDMPDENHWSYKAISLMVELSLLNGTNGKLFPENNLTRAEMATILVRAFGIKNVAEKVEFTDVKKENWFYESVSLAAGEGWFKGDGGKMRPNDSITRQEVFLVLARAINAEGTADLDNIFADANEIAPWALKEIEAMAGKGYVKGANGKINPVNKITRAEFAQLMYNIIMAGEIPSIRIGATDKEQNTNKPSNSGAGGGGGGGGGSAGGGPAGETEKEPTIEEITNSDQGWTGIY